MAHAQTPPQTPPTQTLPATEPATQTGRAGQTDPAAAGQTAITAVTSADVKAGAAVNDASGQSVGTIETVDANGAVISTGTARVKVPLTGLGKNERGLVIAMTKAQLEAQARSAKPQP